MAVRIREQSAPGTPPSGELSIYAKTDNKLYCKNDAGSEIDLTRQNFLAVPFFISGSLTTGVKLPEFLAPIANLTVVSMFARLNSGSGAAVRPSKNGGTADGTILSSIGTTTLNNSQSITLAAGDRLGVNVTTAAGSDLSVTFWVSVPL